jgi:hypothetical protein
MENADHGTVSGKYSDSYNGYSGKGHHENYKYATQDRPTFSIEFATGTLWRGVVCGPLSDSSIYPSLTLATVSK